MNNNAGQDARVTMLQALERPLPTLIVIGVVTVALALITGWWWLLLLGAALGGLVYYASTVVARRARNVAAITGSSKPRQTASALDLRRLEGKYLASMQRALNTRANIERAIADTPDAGVRMALADATKDLEEMTTSIYNLALKACSIERSLQSSTTMSDLAKEIERLNSQINTTTDDFQKSQYYATLDGKLQQMQNFTDTTVAIQRWDAQMDNAMSTLETILSQVLRIKSSEALAYTAATDRLSDDLRREVDELKATSDALDSVYGWSK